MSDAETDFESDSFDEEAEPSPDSLAINLTSEWPVHTDAILAGNSLRNRSWLLTPKMLKKLAAQQMIKLQGIYKLQNRYVPTHLYPLLFAEAARLKNDEAVWFLVSTWPFPVLNFNELELPLECHFGYFTRAQNNDIPLAQSVIRGLLYRSRMHCKMKMMILPKDTSEASEIMKTFMQVGVHYLRDLPDVSLPKVLRGGYYFEGEKYMDLVKKLETKRPISWAAYRRDNMRVIIAMPVAVVHFMGKRQNFDDVLVGLILQRHSPFLFHFDDLALCNVHNTKIAGAILDRVVNPLGVSKLVLHNKRFYRPDDVVKMVAFLSPVLLKFKQLRALFVRMIALLGAKAATDPAEFDTYAKTMATLKHLCRAGFDQQPLSEKLGIILTPLSTPLVKLSLINTSLKPADLRYLATSHHAPALRFLRLDRNDLHTALDDLLALIPRLTSIGVLQTRNSQLSCDDAMRVATVVGQSRTIRSWTLAYNYVHSMDDLRMLLRLCARSSSIREVGCLPADFQQVYGRLFLHNYFTLTDDEKDALLAYGLSLNINVI